MQLANPKQSLQAIDYVFNRTQTAKQLRLDISYAKNMAGRKTPNGTTHLRFADWADVAGDALYYMSSLRILSSLHKL